MENKYTITSIKCHEGNDKDRFAYLMYIPATMLGDLLVGTSLVLFYQSLDKVLRTSTILSFEKAEDDYVVKTRNTIYTIKKVVN